MIELLVQCLDALEANSTGVTIDEKMIPHGIGKAFDTCVWAHQMKNITIYTMSLVQCKRVYLCTSLSCTTIQFPKPLRR